MLYKNRYINNCTKIAINYIKANYYKISNIENWDCPYNWRCHINAIQRIRKHKWYKIYWCYQVDESRNTVIAHFINYWNNKYIETTQWRVGISCYDYYIVKEFKENEFMDKIDAPLDNLKISIYNISFRNRLLNRLYKINSFDIY